MAFINGAFIKRAGEENPLKNNYTATSDPVVTNDDSEGYDVGSVWINITTDTWFACTDNTTGAAVWVSTAAGGGIISVNGDVGAVVVLDGSEIDSTYTPSNYTATSVDIDGNLEGIDNFIGTLTNPLLFKGSISVASDFPAPGDVQNGWFYRISADVTDNDASKTNTGQSFTEGDDIAWNGTDWTEIGAEDAKSIQYDNSTSGLSATDVQEGIDELASSASRVIVTVGASGADYTSLDDAIDFVSAQGGGIIKFLDEIFSYTAGAAKDVSNITFIGKSATAAGGSVFFWNSGTGAWTGDNVSFIRMAFRGRPGSSGDLLTATGTGKYYFQDCWFLGIDGSTSPSLATSILDCNSQECHVILHNTQFNGPSAPGNRNIVTNCSNTTVWMTGHSRWNGTACAQMYRDAGSVLDGTAPTIDTLIDSHNTMNDVQLANTGVTNGHIDDQAQTIYGVKTFDSFMVTPSSDPTTDYQVANKKYVDDAIAVENIWDRTGSLIEPANAGDNMNLGTGKYLDARIGDSADTTKEFLIDMTGVTTGTFRTATMPDYDFTLDSITSNTTTAFTGFLKGDGANVGEVAQIDLTSEVTGTLPVNEGGTNSSVALTNDLVMISSAGAIVESTVTTTELQLLSGIASVSTGTSDNDKFVTQGYVDDAVDDRLKNVETITATDTLDADNDTVLCNNTTDIDVTLPASVSGKEFTIKRINTGVVEVKTTSGNIDNASSYVIPDQWAGIKLVGDGTNHYIVAFI